MTQTDALYRAFYELRKAADDRGIVAFCNAFIKAKAADKITVRHNICHIEEDWIAAIERGLVFIGRAIGEDRQFIRSNGEVQPIEKVRHISRESVEHLSRHSDLITREQKEEIVPDKLYTVERLNDYAVYENRFLYALLLRIRDFAGTRYDAVMRAYRMYNGELVSDKKVVTATRRFTYRLQILDEQDDVFSAAADTGCASALERIGKILQSVAFYLRTPLMTEVSHAALLKKVTKTNVLRMDKNFKETVALYEFLLDYDKDGYTIEPNMRSLDPVGKDVAKELALPAALLSFLTYEHGLGVEEYLKGEFEKEEARREEARGLALAAEIAALKQRIEKTGESPERYMLLLEEHNALLERQKARTEQDLSRAREEIEGLNGKIVDLGLEIEALHEEAEGLKQEISDLERGKQELAAEMERREAEHRNKIEEMRRERTAAEAAIRAEHAEALKRAEAARREELARVRSDCENRVKEERKKVAAKEEEKQQALRQFDEEKTRRGGAERECEVLTARITALRAEKGDLAGNDFTTEEGFNALEREFEILGQLVRDKWEDVRKILRKEFYSAIRATVKGKRGQKSKEYLSLQEQTLARRAQNAQENGQTGEAEETQVTETETTEAETTETEAETTETEAEATETAQEAQENTDKATDGKVENGVKPGTETQS